MLRMRWSDGMGAHCCGPAMARTTGASVDAVPHLICDGLAWSHRIDRNSSRYRRHSTHFSVSFPDYKTGIFVWQQMSRAGCREVRRDAEPFDKIGCRISREGMRQLACQEQQGQRQEREREERKRRHRVVLTVLTLSSVLSSVASSAQTQQSCGLQPQWPVCPQCPQ